MVYSNIIRIIHRTVAVLVVVAIGFTAMVLSMMYVIENDTINEEQQNQWIVEEVIREEERARATLAYNQVLDQIIADQEAERREARGRMEVLYP